MTAHTHQTAPTQFVEARGIRLATDVDHQLVVPKDERLTADDLVNIQRWRAHLGAIVDYRAPEA